MKIMKKATCTLLLLSACAISYSQQPVYEACVGDAVDAFLFNTGTCLPTGWTTLPANTPNGNSPELDYSAWTYTAGGCQQGIIRGLLRFPGLPGSIPPGATLVSAELRLFGVPGSTILTAGNAQGTGGTNAGLLQMLNGPVTWNPATVTWNNFFNPGGPSVGILPSTLQWNWNTTISIPVTWITAMMAGNNDGFLLRLANETVRREVLFASADNPNVNLRPRLIVRYTWPCPSTEFSFRRYSNQPYNVDLSVNNPLAIPYIWSVENVSAGTSPIVVGTTANLTGVNLGAPVVASPSSEIRRICLQTGICNTACSTCREICLYKDPVSNVGCAGFSALFNTAIPNQVDLDPLSPITANWSLTCPGGPSSMYTGTNPPPFTYGLGSFTAGYSTNTCLISMKFCLGAQNKQGNTAVTDVDNAGTFNILSIYPNPATNEVTLSLGAVTNGLIRARIIDVSGKEVLNEQRNGVAGNFYMRLYLQSIPNGIYIIEISQDGIIKREKLIKQ